MGVTIPLVLSNAVTLLLLLSILVYTRKLRILYRHRGLLTRWPIRTVSLDQLDERFRGNEFGPTLRTEVSFIGHGPLWAAGATTDVEAWVLAVMAKGARNLFEFGTCTGRTAYLWARNCAPDGRVTTLTLAPWQVGEYRKDGADHASDTEAAITESRFARFLYSGSEVESRITQLFGDSKAFDETSFVDQCDLVFVDGSHAYSYVRSDSAKALRMIKPGCVVLWHDYTPRVRGVYQGLNELVRELPLVHLAGTTLVAYRRPVDAKA